MESARNFYVYSEVFKTFDLVLNCLDSTTLIQAMLSPVILAFTSRSDFRLSDWTLSNYFSRIDEILMGKS